MAGKKKPIAPRWDHLSDEQLLKRAAQSAKAWQKRLEKERQVKRAG